MKARGPRNAMWKGGRSVASNGYVLVRVGKDHPLADVRGYAYEHRLVAMEILGRPLRKGEQVHHRNGVKTDNRRENLDICADGHEHHARHRTREKGLRNPGEPNPVIACACGCGGSLRKFDRTNRPRRFLHGHNGRA